MKIQSKTPATVFAVLSTTVFFVPLTGCHFWHSANEQQAIGEETPPPVDPASEAIVPAEQDMPRAVDQLRDLLKTPLMKSVSGAKPDFRLVLDDKSTIVSYNCDFGHATWVSWTVIATDIGTTKRSKNFHQEQRLPAEDCLRPQPDALSGSGFDRGHMAPSGDRTRDREFNVAVFSMANIVPQAPQVNQKGWNDLEILTREIVKQGNDAIVVSGTKGSLGRVASSGVNIPAFTWKVVLTVPAGAKKLSEATSKIYAVIYPNNLEREPIALKDAQVSVDELEKQMEVDVLSGLQDDLETRLEKKLQALPQGSEVPASLE